MENDKFERLNQCVYCKSTNLEDLFSAPNRFSQSKEKFALSRCKKCKIVFQNPRVKEEYIGDYYDDDLHYYMPDTAKKNQGFGFKLKSIISKYTLINHFNYKHLGGSNFVIKLLTAPFKSKISINILPTFIANGRILDIGCSHGANLIRLKDLGWSVEGLEMNRTSAELARQLGLSVQICKIEDASFLNNYFDGVIMCMVLEHLHNPFESLKKLTSWIKPGGELIFSIPHFEGFEFSFFKEYAYGVQLPHHIVFFNRKVIIEYLSVLGYQDIRFHFHYFDRDIVASSGFKFIDTRGYFYKLLSQSKIVRVLLIRPFVYMLSLLKKTSRVTVYARKKYE
jgi:2-polyprenyl-3-methyl-5-hydroxy-6-metoxy-1,4-benzoquinol methylase